MAKYYAVYKCPLCLTMCKITDKPTEIPNPEVELPKLLGRVMQNQHFLGNPYLYEAPLYIPHKCSNGDAGLAQLAGFKKV